MKFCQVNRTLTNTANLIGPSSSSLDSKSLHRNKGGCIRVGTPKYLLLLLCSVSEVGDVRSETKYTLSMHRSVSTRFASSIAPQEKVNKELTMMSVDVSQTECGLRETVGPSDLVFKTYLYDFMPYLRYRYWNKFSHLCVPTRCQIMQT